MNCENCKEALTGKRYANVEKKPYCENCFNQLFGNKDCAKCGGHIGDKVVDFEDLQFHPECFICGKCSKILHVKKNKKGVLARLNQFDQGREVFLRGNTPFCEKCYQEDFGTICPGCRQQIKGKYAEFNGKCYHDNCFKCHKCRKALAGTHVYLVRGLIHCDKCSDQ